MIPYLVWSYDYSNATGGVKVMHRLAHELNEAGQTAYVSGRPNPEWNTPQREPFAVADEAHHRVGPDWIAIYPEVVSGNPWTAPRVVRYILNSPGKLGGDSTYDPSEIVFSYSPLFSDAPLLHLPAVELDIYTDRHEPRQGAAVYVGKGVETQAILGATRITLDMREDRHALADVLNRVSVLYSFDPVSGMLDVARLCGCPVVILSDVHRAELDRGMDWTGVGFGYVPPPFDSAAFREHYHALIDTFHEQLASFIRITQEPFTLREIGSRQIGVEA